MRRDRRLLAGAAAVLGLLLPVTAVADSSPQPLTYGVNLNGFSNNRLYSSNTTQNASTLAPAAEPQIAADNYGNFTLSSELGLGGGTDVWNSSNGGKSFQFSGTVNLVSQSAPATAGGGDTAVAVAPVANAAGHQNIYVESLSLGNVDVSVSQDGGKTYTTNYVTALVPGDDRPWITASGPSTVYISYHDVSTFNIDVERSDQAGAAGSFQIVGEAINPLSNPDVVGATNDNQLGNIVASPGGRYVYQIFVAAVGAEENAEGLPMRAVYMGVSTDGGQTFTDYTVTIAPEGTAFGSQFPMVTLDRQGNVYAVYSDNHNIYMSVSTDHGQTWSGPYQVNKTGPVLNPTNPNILSTPGAFIANPNSNPVADGLPEAYSLNSSPGSYYSQELIPAYSNTSVMPWAVAGDAGKVDIVWYGTNMTTGADGVAATDTTDDHTHWAVFMAQTMNALSGSPTFAVRPISPVVHRAGVCEAGVSCTSNGEDNRDLYDDFGIALNHQTGNVVVTYSSDQLDPTDSTYYTDENNASHTAFATQVGGPFDPILSSPWVYAPSVTNP